jgi:hypothetical protein
MLGDAFGHVGLAEDIPGDALNALIGAGDPGDFGLHVASFHFIAIFV